MTGMNRIIGISGVDDWVDWEDCGGKDDQGEQYNWDDQDVWDDMDDCTFLS